MCVYVCVCVREREGGVKEPHRGGLGLSSHDKKKQGSDKFTTYRHYKE